MLFIHILFFSIFDASHARLCTTDFKRTVGLYLNDKSVYYQRNEQSILLRSVELYCIS